MTKSEEVKDWIKEHITGLIIAFFVIIFVVGIIAMIVKNATFNPNIDIFTVEEFMSIERNLYDREKQYKYTLKNDLDFTDVTFNNYNTNFYNMFDGGGFTLKNITLSGDYASIFGGVGGMEVKVRGSSYDYVWLYAEIKNFKVENINITSGNNIGAIISGVSGEKTRYPKIENIEILSGTIGNEESVNVGGIVGDAGDITNGIKNCINRATIKGSNNVGGIIGFTKWNYYDGFDSGAELTTIENNTNYGNIIAYKSNTDDNSSGNAGGILGVANTDCNAVHFKNCKNYGNISVGNNNYAGGIVGKVYFNPLDSFRFASMNYLYVDDCENNGDIIAKNYAGGLVGFLGDKFNGARYKNLTNTGKVVATDYVGGIVGRNLQKQATFINCKNLSETNYIQGINYVAGISGTYGRIFEDCENNMSIKIGLADNTKYTASYIGGIMGFNDDATTMSDYPKGKEGVHFENTFNSGDIIILGNNAESRVQNIGGIAGFAKNMTAFDVENSGDIQGHNYVGGILGDGYFILGTTFSVVKNKGSVTSLGQDKLLTIDDYDNYAAIGNVGGLIGRVIADGSAEIKFDKCENRGNILVFSNSAYIGGFIGYWQCGIVDIDINRVLTITDCTFNFKFGYKSGYGSVYIAQYNNIVGAIFDEEYLDSLEEYNDLYNAQSYEIPV